LIQSLRHGPKRFRSGLANGEHDRKQAGHELVRRGDLGGAAERAGMVEIARVTEPGANGLRRR
jgi:hypothetical protein